MKAVILTYDKRIELADLVISSYYALLGNNNIEWLVPYNSIKPIFLSAKHNNIKFIKSEPGIRETHEALLKNIPDDEFVFWAFDDNYPILINVDFFNSICNFLDSSKHPNIGSIRLFSFNDQQKHSKDDIIIGNFNFYFRYSYNFFWIHQFMKAKLMKAIFINNNLKSNYGIRQVTPDCIPKHMCLTPRNRLYSFGETTNYNYLTKNAFDELNKLGINIPNIDRFKNTVSIDYAAVQGLEEILDLRKKLSNRK